MDTLRWLFLADDGGLRAGWRLLLHLVVLVAGFVVMFVAIGVYMVTQLPQDPLEQLVVQSLVFGAVMLVVHVLSGLVIDIRMAPRLGRGRLRGAGLGGGLVRTVLELFGGIAMGAFALVPAVGIAAIAGIDIQLAELTPWRLLMFGGVSVVLVFAATAEELLFRGYAFSWLGASVSRLVQWALGAMGTSRRIGVAVGDLLGFGGVIVGTSVIFGLLHAGNPGASVLGGVNTVLAGLWFAVLVLRTRSLWPAVGAHWAWNAVHGLVLGMPLSGVSEDAGYAMPSLLVTTTGAPDWLGGGSYGVEGSVGATVACLFMILLSVAWPRRRGAQGNAAFATGALAPDEGIDPGAR